ncbi:nucleotidyltransferase family protein [Halalkalibacter kiskunsagensis]|uniref:Nucleotidyltransferase family protein n=1 Tax=Halalkalibacter kiskunsagensis TaxID=1548599 RepID=A0ABV6KCS9_9BACI
MKNKDICAVILAAGTSTRMGTAKQLLPFKQMYLLEYVIKHVLAQSFEQVFVVIGHNADEIMEHISLPSSRCRWIINDKYQLGQSTSFTIAMKTIEPTFSQAMLFLGDQPFIKPKTIQSVFEEGNGKEKRLTCPFVIRPFYENKPGHPLYWGNIKKLDISTLSGDKGGRGLLSSVKKHHLPVNDPNILVDIDTPADYQKALMKNNATPL